MSNAIQVLGVILIAVGFIGLMRWFGERSAAELTPEQSAQNRRANYRLYRSWMRGRAIAMAVATVFIAGATVKVALEGEWIGLLLGGLGTSMFGWGSVWYWHTKGPFEDEDE